MPSSSRDFFFFFLIQTIFKVFIEFVTILLPVHGLFVFRVFFLFVFVFGFLALRPVRS